MSIIIGSDELILHIRKNYTNCTKSNSDLGREIMQWINKKEHNSDSSSLSDLPFASSGSMAEAFVF